MLLFEWKGVGRSIIMEQQSEKFATFYALTEVHYAEHLG